MIFKDERARDSIIDEGFTHCSTHIVKYPDLNASHFLFGGRLLEWLDEIAAIFAANHIGYQRIVTAHFGGLDFSIPTELGKVVDFWAKVVKEGRTSITVEIIATKKTMGTDSHIQVARTQIVFVAINEGGTSVDWRGYVDGPF